MLIPSVRRLAEAKDSAVQAAGSAIREMALLRAAKDDLERQRANLENRHDAALAHLEKEFDRLHAKLNEERAKPKLAWPKPAKAIPANEVLRAFAIPMDAPLWQALHQVLDQAIQGAVDDATQQPSATQTTDRRTYMSGGVDALREFQGRLLELQASANREDADLQEGEEKA
jgi:hypothetical protein